MKKYLAKTKERLRDTFNPSTSTPSDGAGSNDGSRAVEVELTPPTDLEVIRYRYHWGCNLGSVFVLERWLSPSAFQDAPPNHGKSELAAVTLSVQKNGIASTRKLFEKRWDTALDEKRLSRLKHAHCNAIRLPVGYFTLGPNFCQGTAFEPYGEVYINAWAAVKKTVKRLWTVGIGTLVDFHALPSGANSHDHSGTDSEKADLWKNSAHRNLATACLKFIASEVSKMEGVIGLQIVNEADYHALGLFEWYEATIKSISSIDSTLPVYISDAWDLNTAIKWSQRFDLQNRDDTCPVCIDTHYYACFSDQDKAMSPQELITKVPEQLSALDGKDGNVVERGAAQVIVGEYSCVFDGESWSKSGCAGEQSDEGKRLLRDFGRAQSLRWQQRAGGSYFWTVPLEWPGGAWGFLEQVDTKNLSLPPHLPVGARNEAVEKAEKQRDIDLDRGLQGAHFEYRAGWKLGWNDAKAFFLSGGHIGMLDLWVRKRLLDRGGTKIDVRLARQFEKGLRQSIADFEVCAWNP